jgi:5-hydroxyisourate hydrolase
MGISTHILDTAIGRPASGITVTLQRRENGAWKDISRAATDQDGRCKYLLPEPQALETGTYRVCFDTSFYFAARQIKSLYPVIEITFEVANPHEHYHIPLLLAANGYTTYRGS